jgi:hypothetical protein
MVGQFMCVVGAVNIQKPHKLSSEPCKQDAPQDIRVTSIVVCCVGARRHRATFASRSAQRVVKFAGKCAASLIIELALALALG